MGGGSVLVGSHLILNLILLVAEIRDLCFLVADTRLYTLPCRSVGLTVGRSVGHIFEFRAVFVLLLLPNRPRLDCRVSGLVNILRHK